MFVGDWNDLISDCDVNELASESDWSVFKREFDRDMDALEQSFKDLANDIKK